MKKIYISLMLVLGLGLFTSCDMDKKPFGSIDETTAVQNVNDLGRFRAGVYSALRGMNTGGWITYQDIQMDQFHGLQSNGNRVGTFSNGLLTSADGDIESMFASCYSRIATANYLIEKAGEMAKSGAYDEANLALINRYKAEGHFLRAYCYFFLADHFSQPYAEVDATKEGTGAMLVTKYNPTGDVEAYPSRSSLDATYTLIEKDLEDAYAGLKEYETVDASNVAPNAIYLSSHAVAAMQARVALVKGNYEVAFAKAKEVIESEVYTLATIEEYPSMWINDESNEIIMRSFMSKQEGLASIGSAYTASTNETSADYIPTYYTLANFPDGDVRFDSWFKVWRLDIEGTLYASYVFLKYPGNPALRTTEENNYVNMPKLFRLSEQYLIAAEAGAHDASTVAEASNYMNEFLANRIEGHTVANFTAEQLLTAVQGERERELIGEGFRMSDLRRWNVGFQRYESHDENPALDGVVVAAGRAMKYDKDDYRFTWPMPKTEMDSNPQLKGQQNPGY